MHSRTFFTCIVYLLVSFTAYGQKTEQMTDPEPEGGIEHLVHIFYDIEFTDEQLKRIKQHQVKLLFKVSRHGVATLYKVTDVFGQGIEDSLFSRKYSLPGFEPRLVNGKPHPSFFMLQLIPPFGHVHFQQPESELSYFKIRPKTADVEFAERGRRLRTNVYGLSLNGFLGRPGEFLLLGSGFSLELRFPFQNREQDFVLNLATFANVRVRDLPVETEEEPVGFVSSFMWSFGYAFISGYNRLTPNLQLVSTNLTPTSQERPNLRETRIGTGITYSRLVPLSREILRFRRNTTYFSRRYLSLSLRTSYYFAGSTVMGRGAMIDFCVGYAVGKQAINQLRFKDSFYERSK